MLSKADLALRVTVGRLWADVAGAILMESLGPYAEEPAGSDTVALVFYPGDDAPSDAEILARIPKQAVAQGLVKVERRSVPRDWVDGWKDHFHPIVIGRVRVRPPWEQPLGLLDPLVDVVINPGLGFGTGLHPTTRGALTLLQEGGGEQQTGMEREAVTASPAPSAPGVRGPLVDVGTGSGILAIAAAKLGWGPVIAFDNDADALFSARENVHQNGVADTVRVHECAVSDGPLSWFEGATVLANMTLIPALTLVRRLAATRPSRLVVSGILAGGQEQELLAGANPCGFESGRRVYEAEWVSVEFLPARPTKGA